MAKRFWMVLFLVCAFMTVLTVSALAADIVESGYCGEEGDGTNLTWTLYDNGVLAIGGSGEMGYFRSSDEPWKDFSDQIKTLAFQDGVTRISDIGYPGSNSNLHSIYIPDSVVSISTGFCSRYTAKDIYYAGTSEKLSDIQGIGAGWAEWSYYYGKTFVCYNVDFISWPIPFQTVTFDPNGGSVELKNKPVLINSAYGFLPVPEREGYFFSGWYLSPDSEERVSPSSTVHSSSDHVLYAHWKQSDNLIASGSFGDMLWELDKKGVLNVLGSGAMGNYSYYGGIGGLSSTRPWADYYENIKVIYLHEGITYVGRNVFGSQCNIIYIPKTLTDLDVSAFANTSGSAVVDAYAGKHFLYAGSKEEWISLFGNPEENYPWSRAALYYDSDPPIVYAIRFDANGGALNDEVEAERTVAQGIIYDSMPFTYRSEYIFDGWYTDPVDGERISKSSVVNLSADQTLYAHWKQDSSVIVAYYFKDQVWTLNRDGVLTISGEGYLSFYNEPYCEYFTDNHDINLEKQTKTLIVENGITSIDSDEFWAYENLNKVVLAGSVKSVWTGAFMGCPITDLTLSEGIEWLGSWSFCECTQLTSVRIPASLTKLGESAFGGCTGIKQFDVAPGNSVFQSIDGALFIRGEDGLSLYYYPAGNPRTTYTVPDGVTSISSSGGYGTFSGTSHLKNVILSRGITHISNYAFRSCKNLESIFIPESVTTIGERAFDECPNVVLRVYENSFAHTYAVENDIPFVFIDSELEPVNVISVGTAQTVSVTGETYGFTLDCSDLDLDTQSEYRILYGLYSENGQLVSIHALTVTFAENSSAGLTIEGVREGLRCHIFLLDGEIVPQRAATQLTFVG